MYVEISPRQSGKTTRLVNEVISFLKENTDKTALIVAPKEYTRKDIIYRIQEKCGDLCSKRTITSYKMFPSPHSMKQFVDNINGRFFCIIQRIFNWWNICFGYIWTGF